VVDAVSWGVPFKLEGARAVSSVCPYCAVGCGLLVHVRDGRIVNIEGDPASPINEGTVCPKGAAAFQLAVNPNRLTTLLYRAPRAHSWETRPLGWAMDRIAQFVRETRERTFVRESGEMPVRRTTAIASIGGAVFDNEENYLLVKLMRGLGVVAIENQARV
jgi:formate dehydrogenase major subunit